MRIHLLTPEQAMLRSYYAEVNKRAWELRRVTGQALTLAIQYVPEGMREDVLDIVESLQRKHGVKE